MVLLDIVMGRWGRLVVVVVVLGGAVDMLGV